MSNLFSLSVRAEKTVLIAFADLTRYQAQCRALADQVVADTMDLFYEKVCDRVEGQAGKVVKFMGDAALIVFPEELIDRGVKTLLTLKEETDRWFQQLN